jgi:hypothetical protein
MATTGLQLDPEEVRRNLAITLGNQAQNPMSEHLGLPAGPQMAAPGPINMPQPTNAPNLAITPPTVKGPRGTLDADKAERTRLMTTGPGESQIYGKVTGSQFGQNHPLLGKILGGLGQVGATLGDIGISAVAPGIAAAIPGTAYHHAEELRGVNKQIGNEETEGVKEAQAGHEQAQTAETQARIPFTQAQTAHEQAATEELKNPQPKPKEESWEIAKDYTGPNGEPVEVEKNSGQMRLAGQTATAFKRVQPPEKEGNDFEQFYKDYIKDNNLPDSAHNRLMARKEYSAANQAPQRPAQITVVTPGGQVETLHPGQTITPGSMSATQLGAQNAAGVKEQKAEQKQSENLDSELNLMKQFAASPSPTNDAAMLMHYIGATKPESMGKIRLNDRELKLFGGTRSSLGDVEALFTKVANGQSLTPQQRNDMVTTMTMIAGAAKRGEQRQGSSAPSAAPAATHRWNPETGEIEEIKK